LQQITISRHQNWNMPPLPRSPSNALSWLINNDIGSTTPSRDSKDLRSAVVNLHGQLEQLMKERNYYAERSCELESALSVSYPEVLEQAIAVKTLHIADMLLELDDLNEKVHQLTGENDTLSRDSSKVNILFSEIKLLRSQNIRLKKEKAAERSNVEALSSVRVQLDSIRAENDRLRTTINEQRTSLEDVRRENVRISSQFKKQRASAEELIALRCQVKALQVENVRIRGDLETERKSAEELARVQSSIESLSAENKRLRFQNSQAESPEEVNELRSIARNLSLDNQILRAEKDSMKNIRSQLDTLSFENDKVRTQRDVDRSVLEDLNKVVKSLKDESAVMLDDEHDEKPALKSQVKSLANEVLRLHTEKNAAEDALEESHRSIQLESGETPSQEEATTLLISESAFHQTIDKMKSKIEALEEDKQRMTLEYSASETAIASLQEQVEFKSTRLGVLEEMVKAKHRGQLPRTAPLQMNLKWATSKLQGGIKAVSKKIEDAVDSGHQPQEQQEPTSVRKELYSPSQSRPSSSQTTSTVEGKVRRMRVLVRGEAAIYAGPVSHGAPNGKGSIRFENGSTYLGDAVDGEMHGKGTLYHGTNQSSSMSRGRFEHNVFLDGESTLPSE
jgi:chromosome segregation ATPase